MSEILTMEEIRARYAPDWVLIDEPEIDEHLEVVRGRVVFHSPDPVELSHKAIEMKLKNTAYRYLGERPEHVILGL